MAAPALPSPDINQMVSFPMAERSKATCFPSGGKENPDTRGVRRICGIVRSWSGSIWPVPARATTPMEIAKASPESFIVAPILA